MVLIWQYQVDQTELPLMQPAEWCMKPFIKQRLGMTLEGNNLSNSFASLGWTKNIADIENITIGSYNRFIPSSLALVQVGSDSGAELDKNAEGLPIEYCYHAPGANL